MMLIQQRQLKSYCLFNTQLRVPHTVGLILEINEKATLNIDKPYQTDETVTDYDKKTEHIIT